jgi:hypothetical protein
MVKITKRVVEAAEAQEKDYVIWDDELPGFGHRVFSSGKRSYVIPLTSLYYWTSRSLGARDRTPGGKGATRAGRRG